MQFISNDTKIILNFKLKKNYLVTFEIINSNTLPKNNADLSNSCKSDCFCLGLQKKRQYIIPNCKYKYV